MKPIKFDLIVDNAPCHNLKTLQDNFNILDVVSHFDSGRLTRWLTVRNLAELDAVQAIDKSQDKIAIAKALCVIFNVEASEDDLIDDMMALECYQQQKTDIETIKMLFEQYAAKARFEQDAAKPKPEPEPKPKLIETRSGQFIARDDGTALDTVTGLTWCRYAIGQRWQNGTVVGEVKPMNWDKAMKIADTFNKNDACGGFTDWRLPTIGELKSIVEKNKIPSINQSVFPNTAGSWFWSSSPYAGYSNGAWVVYFSNGYGYSGCKGNGFGVRLVRGGQ